MLLGDPSYGITIDLINERSTDFSMWGRYRLAMFFPTSEYFRPFQIISHMFMHADIGHLFFNMFAVFMFGPPLEATWGAKRFLLFYLVTGFGSVLLHTLVRGIEIHWFGESIFAANVPSLGASGAVFGLLVGYGMLFPENRIMLLFPPIPLKAKYFALCAPWRRFIWLSAYTVLAEIWIKALTFCLSLKGIGPEDWIKWVEASTL
jgi:membrane associated rhomboid family serine protease